MSAELGDASSAEENITEIRQEDKDTDKSIDDEKKDENDTTLNSNKNEVEDEWVDILGSGQLKKRVNYTINLEYLLIYLFFTKRF